MKKVTKMAAQGDLLIRRIDILPRQAKAAEGLVVAHSETGHHHVVVGNARRYTSANPLVGYLVATESVDVEHHREWDTHETLVLEEGIYEIRRQREYVPGGWRQVVD